MTNAKLPQGKRAEIAKTLGVSGVTAGGYINRGLPVDGTPDDWREWKRTNVRARTGGGRAIGETARLRRAQADAVELDVHQKAGSLMLREDHDAIVMAVLGAFATGCQGFGARVAGPLAGMTEPAQIRRYVDDELDRVRASAAEALERMALEKLGEARGAPSQEAAEDAGPVG